LQKEKKKEAGKSSIVLDIKPWDDETDLAKLEASVRSIQVNIAFFFFLYWNSRYIFVLNNFNNILCTYVFIHWLDYNQASIRATQVNISRFMLQQARRKYHDEKGVRMLVICYGISYVR
jgi:hypothetical protein